MPKNTKAILATALLLLSLTGLKVAAQDTPFMSVTGRTSQPIGHYDFCRSHRPECEVRTSQPGRVRLTPDLWSQLVATNNLFNRTIAPATDQELFGRPEVWTYATASGDCEDYVLLKRRALIALGWPTSALLITVVEQQNGDGHAVLTVRTDRGDLVLDNLQTRIVLWNESGYRFVKRQSEFNSGQWMAIADRQQNVVGSLSQSR